MLEIRDISVFFQRDVEIDDVPIADDVVACGDAMADNMVTRAIQYVVIPVLPFARWAGEERAGDVVVDHIIDLQGRHMHEVNRVEHLEYRCQHTASGAHQSQLVRCFHHGQAAVAG